MESNGEVNYDEYSVKNYIWKEDGRVKKPKSEKHKRKIDFNGVIAAVLIFLCFFITLLSVNYISGESLLQLMKKMNNGESTTYYAVAADSYESAESISIDADELRLLGGAGYLINDEKYYLIAAVYSNLADAEKILEGISSPSACIYDIKLTEPSLKWCNDEDLETVKNTLTYAESIYNVLYSVSVRLDKGDISEFQAMSEITVLKTEIEALQQTFGQLDYTDNQLEFLKIKVELMTAVSMLDGLASGGLYGNDLVADVRYSYTLILISCRNLLILI